MGRHQVEFKIEYGIEVPPAATSLREITSTIYNQMSVGSSVFFENHRDADNLRQYIKRKNGAGSFAIRKIKNKGWRGWMLK